MLQKFIDVINPNRRSPIKIDKIQIQNYTRKYALSKNPNFPYFKENDCTNFISQVIYSGGIKQIYGKWNDYNTWFCITNSSKELYKISLTWRSARYFAKHFGNENGFGRNRAKILKKQTITTALKNYNSLYKLLDIGCVLQYINIKKSPYPYHTQIVCNKDSSDIYIAQHSRDLLDYPLTKYLNMLENKDTRFICIYKFD